VARPGNGREVTRSSPTTLLWPKPGAERHRRARSAASGGAGRCGLATGETAARSEQGVAWGGSAGH
jgi:hypothetical protein